MHVVRRHRKQTLTVAAAVCAALTSAGTLAQDATSSGSVLEEVIVTAQRRSENLQQVPAAISVLGSDMIANASGFNIESLTALVPSLNFRKGGTTINSTLFLRGVGTVNFSLAAEPSVSTVLDGVVLARAGEAFNNLYDVERIEVLRGPQGTLFGKNASAGVVHIVSKMPSDEFGVGVDFNIYEDEEYQVKGTIDAPLSESFRTRLTAFYSEYDGNIRNLTDGEDINGYEQMGLRGIAQWDATEDLAFTFIADWREADDDCCGEVIGTRPSNAATGAALTGLLSGVDFAEDETRKVRHNLVTATEDETWGASMQVDWNVGSHVLTSITAYREWNAGEVREGDWLDTAAAYVGNGFAQLHDDGPQEGTTFSQEVRLASPLGQFFEYVAGVYYFDSETERDFARSVIVCTASTLPINATGQRPCAQGSSTYTFPFSSANFGSESTNYSLFGQGTLNFTDSLRAILGLRWTNDELSYFHDRVPSPVAGPGVRTDRSGFRGETDNDEFSGTAGLQWDISDELMSYVKYSRGYKGPAYNVFFNMNPTQLNALEPETSDAYELGLKATLFDGSAIANLAIFEADYDNFQANNFDTLNGVVITRLTNAGEISTSGVELDLTMRPFDGLTLTGGLAYTDAQIEKFRVPPGAPPSATDRNGERLPFAPEWKGALMVDYRWEAFSAFDMFFNTTLSYTDSQFTDLGENPLLEIDSYALLDASIGVAERDDRWRVALIGNNLTDQSYPTLITTGGPGGALRYIIPRDADRYFGVQLRANFGGPR